MREPIAENPDQPPNCSEVTTKKAENNDAAHQQDELDHADPGAGLQTAGADIEPDDEGHEDGTEGDRYAGDNVEQGAEAISCTAE
jgi:hypothetical protein